jgi:hypothetical protein
MTILSGMIGQFSVAGGEEEEVVWSVGRLIRDGCFARLIYGTSLLAEEKQSMQEWEGCPARTRCE